MAGVRNESASGERGRVRASVVTLVLALGSHAGCRDEPAPIPVRADTVARERTVRFEAKVLDAKGFDLAKGAACELDAELGPAREGMPREVLLRGRCGTTELVSPVGEDLGDGSRRELSFSNCEVDERTRPDGRLDYGLRCARRGGPRAPTKYAVETDGATLTVERTWEEPGRVVLEMGAGVGR